MNIINAMMSRSAPWVVEFADEFVPEFAAFTLAVKEELVAQAKVIAQFGPMAGRPHVDTLNGSKHANMKEMRFDADGGVWRVAFAFDPRRRAVLFVGGDKSGSGQAKFYKRLIATADQRFDAHLQRLEAASKRK